MKPTHGTKGRPAHPDILTPAEWRVVQLTRHGHSNQAMAERLGVSINAIKYHLSNITGKLGIPNKKALIHWDGAPKNSPYHRTQLMNEATIKQIGQIARTVTDIAVATAWYRDQLQLNHLYSYGPLAFFECHGVRLMLSENKESEPTDSIIYFQTEDIKSAYASMQDREIEFTHAPHKIHTHEDGSEEWMAFFQDPDGQALGLMAKISPQ